jgi:hypothetical protein
MCEQYCVLCMDSTAVSVCACIVVLCVLTDCISGSRSLDLEQCHSIRVITRYSKTVITKHEDRGSMSSIGGNVI